MGVPVRRTRKTPTSPHPTRPKLGQGRGDTTARRRKNSLGPGLWVRADGSTAARPQSGPQATPPPEPAVRVPAEPRREVQRERRAEVRRQSPLEQKRAGEEEERRRRKKRRRSGTRLPAASAVLSAARAASTTGSSPQGSVTPMPAEQRQGGRMVAVASSAVCMTLRRRPRGSKVSGLLCRPPEEARLHRSRRRTVW